MDFSELEAAEGLRWTWHAWPSQRKAAEKMVIPLAIMCCPLFSPKGRGRGRGQEQEQEQSGEVVGIPRLPYSPIRCSSCRGVLNPYARLDPSSNHHRCWTCPFCFHRNTLPLSHHHHHSPSTELLPAELFPAHTCVEYILPPPALRPYAVSSPYQQQQLEAAGPAFLFVIDTCLSEQDLVALKKAVSHTVGLLPGNAVVGLLSFAAQVHVHDFGSAKHYMKALVFDWDRECTTAQVCYHCLAFTLSLTSCNCNEIHYSDLERLSIACCMVNDLSNLRILRVELGRIYRL